MFTGCLLSGQLSESRDFLRAFLWVVDPFPPLPPENSSPSVISGVILDPTLLVCKWILLLWILYCEFFWPRDLTGAFEQSCYWHDFDRGDLWLVFLADCFTSHIGGWRGTEMFACACEGVAWGLLRARPPWTWVAPNPWLGAQMSQKGKGCSFSLS